MKRKFGMLLVLSTALILTSCGNKVSPLEEAAEYYYQTIKDDSTSLESYQLNSKLVVAGVTYTVTWDLYVKSGIASNVVLSDTVNDKGMYDVTVKYSLEDSTVATEYTLTCTLTDAEGNTKSFSVDRVAPEFKFTTHEEYMEACLDKSPDVINVKGYVIGYNADPTSSGFGSIYLQDKNGGGYYAYCPTLNIAKTREAMEAAYPYGTEIIVSGTATNYSGQFEFNKGCAVQKTGNTLPSADLVYTNATEAFKGAKNAKDADALNKYQNARVKIEGAKFTRKDGAYLYFTIGDGTQEFNIYSSDYMLTEDECKTLEAKFTPGYEATITGVVSVYSSVFQIYPDSLDTITITNAVITDEVAVGLGVSSVEELFKAKLESDETIDLPATDDNGVAYTYTVKEGTGVKLNDKGDLEVTQTAEESTNVLTVTCKKGEKTETKDITITVASALPNFVTLADAVAAEKGTKVAFLAEVKSIGEKDGWSDQYKNMSVTVTDGTTDLYVFRTTTKLEVGDKVLVQGTMDEYKGTKQIAQGSEVVKFDATTLTSVKAASEAEDGVDVTIVGLVTGIAEKDAWNEEYSNMSFTVTGADGTEYYVYRTKVKAEVGDFVILTGKTASYKENKQLGQGSTGSVLEVPAAAE